MIVPRCKNILFLNRGLSTAPGHHMSRSLEPTDARKNRKDVMKTQTLRAERAYSAPVVDRTNEGPNFANGAMSAPAGR